MSGNRNSGGRNRTGGGERDRVVAPRSPSDQAARLIQADARPLTAVPPMPDSEWRTARAVEIWERLGQRLLDHQLLSELDLDLLELTVHFYILAEDSAKAGDHRGSAASKISGCLRDLGLTRSGRAATRSAAGHASKNLFADLMPPADDE